MSYNTKQKLHGLTLIELMLALTVTTMIFTILITVYISAENNFLQQSTLSREQENARLAIELLSTDIRMAGYVGCLKITADFPLKNIIDAKNKISVTTNTITVRHVNLMHANLLKEMRGESTLHVTPKPDFVLNDILIISDCKAAEVLKVKKIFFEKNNQKITTDKPLINHFAENAEIGRLEINTYFIDKTDHKSVTGEPIYALYVRDITGERTELVEGINALTFHEDAHGVEIELAVATLSGSQNWYSYVAFRN